MSDGHFSDSAATDLLRAIAEASFQREGLRCARLMRMTAETFATVRSEALGLCAEARPSNVGDERHVTHWTRPRGEVVQYSLLNRSGRFDDYSDDHDRCRSDKRFAHAEAFPALAALAAMFPHAVNFRINVLGRQARLSPHQEAPLFRTGAGGLAICARFHLPIQTGAGAELVLDGDVLHLEEAQLYFVNHGCVHAARNLDASRRIHLVWDMLLCREAAAQMFGVDPMPAGWERIAPAARAVPILRTERMGAANHLLGTATEEEALNVDFSPRP